MATCAGADKQLNAALSKLHECLRWLTLQIICLASVSIQDTEIVVVEEGCHACPSMTSKPFR